MSFLHGRSFFYIEQFLRHDELSRLNLALEAIPVGSHQERWASDSLMLAPPVSDDIVVQGRLEGASGWPIWTEGTPHAGPEMPNEFVDLARQATDRLTLDGFWDAINTAPGLFTSVYVDRYPRDGRFVPHTDRDCYGPVVAGVSGGVGSCRLSFSGPGGETLHFTLRPGSLYAFTGNLRYTPWVHYVDNVDDVRYAISFRNAVAGLTGTEACR